MIDLDFNPLPPEPETAYCPICCLPGQSLPVSEFGICHARPSGRNLYCKACIRKKVANARRELREYLATQKRRRAGEVERLVTRPLKVRCDADGVLLPNELRLRCNEPHERVFSAIYHGARTQREIVRATGLCYDGIGDALAILLLGDPKRIKAHTVDDVRCYSPVVSRGSVAVDSSWRAA